MNHQALSKIRILVVFAILLAGGIFVWQYTKVPQEEEITEITPEQVISQFYQCYIGERLEKNLTLESAINNCDALEEGYKQSLFGKEIHLTDPVIWAQDYPDENDIQVEEVEVKDDNASVIIGLLPKTFWLDHKVKAFLVLVNNEWKISNIEDISRTE